ncbi:hypothetical protein [Chroococcidiopsis sp. CCMEE 29]|uniref:hypothetical protein n=1 Tax=Chroococcidiopsis sp. CCMEE 29 TaxID=155894 RepID=UPI00202267D0|nr:hypothetical protein [Chroococcidiopsis sp. CCMEE 29]
MKALPVARFSNYKVGTIKHNGMSSSLFANFVAKRRSYIAGSELLNKHFTLLFPQLERLEKTRGKINSGANAIAEELFS